MVSKLILVEMTAKHWTSNSTLKKYCLSNFLKPFIIRILVNILSLCLFSLFFILISIDKVSEKATIYQNDMKKYENMQNNKKSNKIFGTIGFKRNGFRIPIGRQNSYI